MTANEERPSGDFLQSRTYAEDAKGNAISGWLLHRSGLFKLANDPLARGETGDIAKSANK